MINTKILMLLKKEKRPMSLSEISEKTGMEKDKLFSILEYHHVKLGLLGIKHKKIGRYGFERLYYARKLKEILNIIEEMIKIIKNYS